MCVKSGSILLSCIVLFVAAVQPAQAYTDPGSGALIWQALMAAFVGGLFYFRRILNWFKRKRGAEKPSAGGPGETA